MKLRFFILTLSGTMICSAFAQKKVPSKAELDASKIIQFSNTMIDLGNSYSQTFDSYQSVLESADSDQQRLAKNPNIQAYFVRCSVDATTQQQKAAYSTALKAAQTFPEKADIVKYVTNGENHMKSVGTWCASLSSYFSGKQYKEDSDRKAYMTIRDSLIYHLKESSSSWHLASQQASVAGDQAELVLLSSSKIASFVIPMKKDLIGLENVFNMLNSKKPDLDAIQSSLSELSASMNKNKDITTKNVSKLSDAYYKDVYQTFYRKCINSVESLTTITSKLKNSVNPNTLNSWFSSADSDYNGAIESYNTFIKQ